MARLGNDSVDGGAGNDIFSFAAPSGILEAILNIQPPGGQPPVQANVVATVSAGANGAVILDGFSNGESGVATLSNVETVQLTDKPDTVLVDDTSGKT